MTTDLDATERRELRRKARAATLDALQALGGEAQRAVIHEVALANGGFTPRELAARPTDSAENSYERIVDHQLSWALTNLKRDGLVENPSRGIWRLAGASLEPVGPATKRPAQADRLAELRKMPYREYLQTPEWRRTRAAAIARAGNCCSLDVTHGDDLEVHHRTYERLGEELATDLAVLCHDCHELHHRELGRPRRDQPSSGTRTPRAAKSPAAPKPSLLRRLLAR